MSAVLLGSECAAFHQKRLKEHGELLDALVRERLEASTFYSAIGYIQALRLRTVLMDEARRLFEMIDVLMLPAGNVASKLKEETVGSDIPRDTFSKLRPDSFQFANVTGIPLLLVPCGFTAGLSALSLGIQFSAQHFDTATLFRIGISVQRNWIEFIACSDQTRLILQFLYSTRIGGPTWTCTPMSPSRGLAGSSSTTMLIVCPLMMWIRTLPTMIK